MAEGGLRAAGRIVLATVLVPLALLGLGLWEARRGEADRWELEMQRGALTETVARMEARVAAEPRRVMEVQFRRNGQLYGGPYAVQKAREALDDAGTALRISRWRQWLPPVTMVCAGLFAGLSVLALVGAAILARAGRGSRDALVRGFSVLHRLLPPLLGAQVLLLAACCVAVVGFEAMALLETGDFSSGSLKVLAVAAVVIGASLWTAAKSVLQLRRTVALFTPDPMPIGGRPVSAAAAPGLWRLLDDLSARLGALRPDNVVVGLTGGFFVTSGPKLLQPGGVPLEGRTLYLPLPYLPLLRSDELAAIIGHELAHFSGSDTEYSLRFLPIYAGVERSLDAVVAAGTTSAGSLSLLSRPALRLGVFVMERFHHTVRHWSRLREFAADAAGAGVTTTDAAARALLRAAAVEGRIDETLHAAFEDPAAAPPDLVAATVAHAAAKGLDDPAARLGQRQPHPTDTHPPTQQRLAALGREPGPDDLAQAAAPPAAEATALLSALFADPAALCRTATTDFLDMARDRARAEHQALEEAAAAVDGEEQALHEDLRGTGIALVGMGVVFVLIGAALLVFGLNGLGPTERQALGWLAVVGGAGMVGWSLLLLRRRPEPFLVLRRNELLLPALDRPVAWAHVLDLDMTLDRGRVSTRLLLSPDAPFPARGPRGRRVKLDPKQRIVTFTAGLPRGMKAQDYADLLGRHRMADAARRELAAEAASHHAPPHHAKE